MDIVVFAVWICGMGGGGSEERREKRESGETVGLCVCVCLVVRRVLQYGYECV